MDKNEEKSQKVKKQTNNQKRVADDSCNYLRRARVILAGVACVILCGAACVILCGVLVRSFAASLRDPSQRGLYKHKYIQATGRDSEVLRRSATRFGGPTTRQNTKLADRRTT